MGSWMHMVHHGELKVRDRGLCVCSLSAAAVRESVPDAIEKRKFPDGKSITGATPLARSLVARPCFCGFVST